MKVLYIIGGKGRKYGSERIAASLLLGSRDTNINYIVICAKEGFISEYCKLLDIECHVIPFMFFTYYRTKNWIFNNLKRIIKRGIAEYYLLKAVKRIESVVSLDDIDLIHTNLSRDLVGAMLSKKYNIPHIWHIQEMYNAHYGISLLKNNQVEWMNSHCSRFIAISDTVNKDWCRNGIDPQKVVSIPNGIYLSSIIEKENYIPNKTLRIVMVGHVDLAKGQEKVIAALEKLPNEVKNNIVFDIYGGIDDKYRLYLEESELGKTIDLNYKGFTDDIGKILFNYDIGINYSRGEGFGLSTVEYMAAGLCVIASDKGANKELIDHGVDGIITKYNDTDDFISWIVTLFYDRGLIEKIGREAKKTARYKYDVKKMQNRLFDLYKETTNSV